MDELQIIDDILEQLYGYEIFFRSNDEKLIKEKKREKNEKQDDMMKQIDLMCTTIKKELRSEMGEAFYEINTDLRAFVLDSIHKEVKNGNNVIDANGKINFKKFKVILLEQKNKIIKENSSKISISKEENNEKKYFENDDKNKEIISEIKGLFANNGIELSEEEATTVRDAVRNTNNIHDKYKKYKKIGLTNEEIFEKFKEEYQMDEIVKFVTDAGLAIGVEILRRQNVNKDKPQGNLEEKNSNLSDTENFMAPKGESTPMPTSAPPPTPAPMPTPTPTPTPTPELITEPAYISMQANYYQHGSDEIHWNDMGWLDIPGPIDDLPTTDMVEGFGDGFCDFISLIATDVEVHEYCETIEQPKSGAVISKIYNATGGVDKDTTIISEYEAKLKSTLRTITGISHDLIKDNQVRNYNESYGTYATTEGKKNSGDITQEAPKGRKRLTKVKPKEKPIIDKEVDVVFKTTEDEIRVSENEPELPTMEEIFVFGATQPTIQSQIEEEKNRLEKLFPGLSSKYPVDQGKEGLPIRNMKNLYGQRGSLRETEESASTVGSLNGTKEERTDGDKTPTTPSDEEKE